MSDQVKVLLNGPWKDHLPGDVVEVDRGTANGLRDAGYGAIVVDEEPAAEQPARSRRSS